MINFLKKFAFIKNHWKKGIAGLVLLGLGIIGFKAVLGNNKTEQYKLAKVQKQNLIQTVSASGKVSSEEIANLRFQTSGRLAWIGVKKGDKVKKWQAIASLDKRELEKRLKQELLDYMNERWDFEQTTLDDYKDQALTETIRRAKEQAQFDLDRVVLDVEIADIALQFSTLITPIDGVVVSVAAPHPGINITPATAEIVVANPDKMILVANIDEVDIGRIFQGQKTLVLLDAYPEEELELTVKKIGFDATTTAGGGTAFPVEFSLPPYQGEKFKLGMNGDVEVIVSEANDVLTVPFETIKEDNKGSFVYVLKDGRPEKKRVEIGFSNDIDTQIKSGLNENDEVVVSGVNGASFLK
jgi:HlyD family secretion protein